jgi:PAS domain S-box-containing protein/putative nucleotidyltransferase with HDIG domain
VTSKHKAAEKAPFGPKEELEAVLDSAKDGMVLVDRSGRILRINKTITEASGYNEDEIIGKSFDALNMMPPQVVPQMFSLLNNVLSGQQVQPFEVDTYARSGEKLSLEVHLSPLRKGAKIVGAFVTTRNIVERKMAAEALINSDERFRNLVENTSDWVWEVNEKAVYTYVSPKVREILGYEPQEVLGKAIFDLMPLKEATCMTKTFASAIVARQPLKFVQIINLHKNGHSVMMETSAAPILDSEGQIHGYRGIHRDVTGRRQTEQQLAETMVKLEKTVHGIIQAMTLTVEMRDRYTAGHQQRVAQLAYAIAKEVGRSHDLGQGIRTAGLLHDLGKIFIPIEILTKAGQLTEDEFATVKNHPKAGYDILKNIEFPWPIAEIVLQHHERIDGSGYPSGLKNNEIFLEARILGVADAVEAMVYQRSYRPSLGLDKALKELVKAKGVLYDHDAVEGCLNAFLDRGFKFEVE